MTTSAWNALAHTPYQDAEWYRAAGVLDKVTLLSAGSGSGTAFLPVWRVNEDAHYYHVPRNMLCGHREEAYLAAGPVDAASVRERPWGHALVTVSPYGYHGGPVCGPSPDPGALASLADQMLNLADEQNVSCVLSHFLFEDPDSAWIEALAERGGTPIVLGADCGMDVNWPSVRAYLDTFGPGRRSVRRAHVRMHRSNVGWTIQRGPGPGPGQDRAAELFGQFVVRFDEVDPPPDGLLQAVADGSGIERILVSVAEPGQPARSIMAVLARGGVLYPKFFGTLQPRTDYFSLAYCWLIEYAITQGWRRIEFGGGTHQAKLLRGARLRYALGVLFVNDDALRAPALAAARALSDAKLGHFDALATTWQLDHRAPVPPAAVATAAYGSGYPRRSIP
jgi:hypothetical protein